MRGALAGLIGGLAGAAAKSTAEKVFPPRTNGQPAPPLLLVERVGEEAHVPLSESEKTNAVKTIHWAFGGLTGAVYGAMVELSPRTAAWQGAAFGLALNKMTHEGVLPVMGLNREVSSQSQQERNSERTTHVVYGVVTELVRRIVRSRF